MNRLSLSLLGAAALLGAGAASAQTPPPPGGPGEGQQQAAPNQEAPPPPGGPGFYGRMHRGFMGPPGMGPGMAMGMRPPPPRGTHFHFGRGDAVVDVRCAANESTRACADAVASLLDKLQGTQAR